ncbi:hypothetical protein B0H14DRAFT_3469211 [Mycena olivaceomarginata]|nr:hypothetical protein B0H14DRAFT_3469211 [Mycena olivaceomarginata]
MASNVPIIIIPSICATRCTLLFPGSVHKTLSVGFSGSSGLDVFGTSLCGDRAKSPEFISIFFVLPIIIALDFPQGGWQVPRRVFSCLLPPDVAWLLWLLGRLCLLRISLVNVLHIALASIKVYSPNGGCAVSPLSVPSSVCLQHILHLRNLPSIAPGLDDVCSIIVDRRKAFRHWLPERTYPSQYPLDGTSAPFAMCSVFPDRRKPPI